MPREQPQFPCSVLDVLPITRWNPMIGVLNFLKGLTEPADTEDRTPSSIATPRIESAPIGLASEPLAGCQDEEIADWASLHNRVHQHDYGQVVNIERVGIAITGTNYGHVTQTDEFNVLRNLPVHPDISGHLSDYFAESRADNERCILQWIDSRHPPELVLCVLGKVGVGKSTLAKHLATRLGNDKRLAANIFFGFALPDWSVKSVVRMAAGQLCAAFPALTRAVCEAIRLDVDPSISIETRIQKLILEPIQSLHLPYTLVILLDALDQWPQHPLLIKALSCLASATHLIKFLVFGRPGLEDRFQDVTMRIYPLPDIVDSVMVQYFRERFNQMQWEYGCRPSSQTIDRLVHKASGLFIWSSTFCSLLEDELSCPSPHETITAVLQSQKSVGNHDILATLYHDAINLRFPKPDHKANLKVILGALLVLQEPLPIAAFAPLVSMTARIIRKILDNLRPLQTGQNNQDMVYPVSMRFHLSFLEYLQSTDTPSHLAFPIDTFTSHSQLGKACLEELRRQLSLPQSTFITPLQQYATRYWPTHIAHGTPCMSPTPDVEWKATLHFAILNSMCLPQWQRWAMSYLQLVHPGTTQDLTEPVSEALDMPVRNTPCDLIYQQSLLEAPATTSPSGIVAVAKVVVQRQYPTPDAWLASGRAYKYAAYTTMLLSLLSSAVQACWCATEIGGDGGNQVLAMLAGCLHERFLRFGGSEDLAEAIALGKVVLLLRPPGHPGRATALNNLGTCLHHHSKLSHVSEGLEEAIVLYLEALSLCPPGHPNRATCLNNLATSFRSRFVVTGAAEDLDKAIVLLREALLLLPSGHTSHTLFLYNLATTLQTHFNQTWVAESLNEAIMLYQEVFFAYPDHASLLGNLADALRSYFDLKGIVRILDVAISLYREALSLQPMSPLVRPWLLNNLATSLQCHFKQTGAAESLVEAILLLHEALLVWPSGHPNRASSLNNLATTLCFLYQVTDATGTLDEAIALYREALLLWLPGHPSRSYSLNHLANSLNHLANSFRSRFAATGVLKHLDEAIALYREALSLCPPGHPYRSYSLNHLANSLNHLANSFRSRFAATGALKHVDEAIALFREALSLWPPGHPCRGYSLNSLTDSLQSHFEQTAAIESLEETIILRREALSLHPSDYSDRAASLNKLGTSLRSRCELTGTIGSLDEGIVCFRQALWLSPKVHPQYGMALYNLAISLMSHFKLTGSADSINEAIM